MLHQIHCGSEGVPELVAALPVLFLAGLGALVGHGLNLGGEAVRQAAAEYPVKRVELCGFYTNGMADADSGVDFLVEFAENPTSLLQICGFRETLSELLYLDVDIVKLPRKPNDGLQIDRTVPLYGA